MLGIDLDDKIVSYTMEGTSFDNGFDLNDTLTSLNHFQNILDKAYLTIINKERMSKADRETFKIKVTDIRKGSFMADFILYTGAAIQVAYPIINTYYPSLLLDITKQGFTYLKTILKADKEGKKISVSNTDEGDVMIVNIEGDNSGTINIGTNAFIFAGRAFEDFKSLSAMIDNENIRNINIFDKIEKQEIIKLDKTDRDIFKIESKLGEEPVTITGRIFRIDVRAKSGKMLVIDSNKEDLPKGEFSFEIMLDDDIEKCCMVIDKEAKFKVLERIQYDPTTFKNEVKSLRIIRVD